MNILWDLKWIYILKERIGVFFYMVSRGVSNLSTFCMFFFFNVSEPLMYVMVYIKDENSWKASL